MERSLNDVMRWPWEEAFRRHLRRLVAEGEIRDDVVTIGPWWNRDSSVELDAVGWHRLPVLPCCSAMPAKATAPRYRPAYVS
jgi:hypothetical protein